MRNFFLYLCVPDSVTHINADTDPNPDPQPCWRGLFDEQQIIISCVQQEKENLFLYVSQAFAPSPDQTLANLCECFGSEGKLVLYYSRSLL